MLYVDLVLFLIKSVFTDSCVVLVLVTLPIVSICKILQWLSVVFQHQIHWTRTQFASVWSNVLSLVFINLFLLFAIFIRHVTLAYRNISQQLMFCDKFYSAANGITILMLIFSVQLKMAPSVQLRWHFKKFNTVQFKMLPSIQISSRWHLQFKMNLFR